MVRTWVVALVLVIAPTVVVAAPVAGPGVVRG